MDRLFDFMVQYLYCYIAFVILFLIFFFIFVKDKSKENMIRKLVILLFPLIPIYLGLLYLPIYLLKMLTGINDFLGAILILFAVICIYNLIKIGVSIINKIKTKDVKNEGIYVRDVPVNYSPAVLSYLQNQKIEPKKDLIASILNLCSKKVLKINKNQSDMYELEEMESSNYNNLNQDERYIYNAIRKKEKINISIWSKLVREEYKRYNFSKPTGIDRFKKIYRPLFALGVLLSTLTILKVENMTLMYKGIYLFGTVLVTASLELLFLEPIIIFLEKNIRKSEYIGDKYTVKGAIEMARWEKYKKFLQDFTLIKERNLDSVIILEKHLAYAMVLNENKSYKDSIIKSLEVNYDLDMNDIINNSFDCLFEEDT